MVIAGGASARKLNLDAFIQQAGDVRGVGLELGQAEPDARASYAHAR